jgi:hypothetical protein
MPKLVIHAGTPQAKEFELKQGKNFIGRGFANDFQIQDGSVSTQHCQIMVDGNQVHFQDLGSTNGSRLNGAPVQEATLQSGQRLSLGGVELLFQGDVAEGAGLYPTAIAAAPAAAAMSAGGSAVATAPPASGLRISRPHAPDAAAAASASSAPAPAGGGLRIAGLAPTVATPPPPSHEIPTPPPVTGTVVRPTGKVVCKYHPKSTARWSCPKCGQLFCDLCVTARSMGGETGNFCRKCAVACNPVEIAFDASAAAKRTNFFSQIGGAFGYPFKHGGLFILVGGTIFFALVQFLAGYSLYLKIVFLGYMFAFMQNVIHCTANGDDDEPSLPDISNFAQDILIPCFQLLGIVLLCFGPAIGMVIWAAMGGGATAAMLLIPTVIFGCLYFPMAFLAAAMFDSVTAINPLVVIPAICKVPLQYLVTFVLLGAVFLVRWAGDAVLPMVIPVPVVPTLISSFIGLYFLTVECRMLGLLYYTNKHKLGWFNR